MKTLYRLYTTFYTLEDGRWLRKAKYSPSPGQLSMFDESEHPRDGSGRFSSGGGSADGAETERAPEGATKGVRLVDEKVDEKEAARIVVAQKKRDGYSKISEKDAAYVGLDHKHPMSHWGDGTESFFGDMIAAYKDAGNAGVGQSFIKSLDLADESGWKTGNILAKNTFNTADWGSLQGFLEQLLSGGRADVPGGNAATGILARYLKDIVESGLEDDKEDGSDAFTSRMSKVFASSDELKAWLLKKGAARLDKDESESGVPLKLAEAALKDLDPAKLGQAIAQELKIPEAIRREEEAGHKNGVITPWEESDHGRDVHAWDIFEDSVNWSAVGLVARKIVEDPTHDWSSEPITPFEKGKKHWTKNPESRSTVLAVELLEKLLTAGGADAEEIKKDFMEYEPARIARSSLRRNIKTISPGIRELAETYAKPASRTIQDAG